MKQNNSRFGPMKHAVLYLIELRSRRTGLPRRKFLFPARWPIELPPLPVAASFINSQPNHHATPRIECGERVERYQDAD